MRADKHIVYLLGFVFLAVGCGATAEKSDCNDGIDNDFDGFIDDADPGCAFTGGATEAPDPAQCIDGLDNDGDGLVDMDDYGCTDSSDNDETDPTRACNDGVDNDSDGHTDYPDDTRGASP